MASRKKGKKGSASGGTLCGGCKKQGPITMRRCGGCHAVAYCSTECQKSHWKTGGHKKACLDAQARRKAASDPAAAAESAVPQPPIDSGAAPASSGPEQLNGSETVDELKYPCPICTAREEDFGRSSMCSACGAQFCGDCCHAGGLNQFDECPICKQQFRVPTKESLKRLKELLKLKLSPRKKSLIQSNIGCYYLKGGPGVPVCYPKAVEHLKRAAEGGRCSALHNLASVYLNGLGVKKDAEKAAELLKRAAEQDFAESQATLANCYETGTGVAKSKAEARRWYQAAARNGHPEAHRHLQCENQPGGALWDQSEEDVLAVVRAAENGDSEAQYRASRQARAHGDTAKELEWLRRAAAEGQPDALVSLASHLSEHGGDSAEIVRMFEAAASKNNPRGQACLGIAHLMGRWGYEKDYTKAFHWFGLAADQGDEQSMFNLGYMHGFGCGTAVDAQKEAEWYLKAANRGHVQAQYHLALMCGSGRGIPLNEKQALEWMDLAVRQNYAPAQYQMALWNIEGVIKAENPGECKRLLELAAASGHEDAITALRMPIEALKEVAVQMSIQSLTQNADERTPAS